MDVVVWKEEIAYKIALGFFLILWLPSILSFNTRFIAERMGSVLVFALIIYWIALGFIKFRNHRQKIKKD